MAHMRKFIYAFSAGRIAFGLALLAAPSKVGSSWLGEDAEREPVHIAIRGLGARDIALAAGGAAAAARGAAVRPWLIGCLACDLADIAATLAAGDRVPPRARWGTVGLAGAAAIAGAALTAAVDE
jgi:hypothetical protein